MAWLSRVNFIASDTLSFTDINNLGNDIRAWGDNVNGGAYTLSNVVVSAASISTATLTTTGNVGVGRSNPFGLLDVNGKALIGPIAANPVLAGGQLEVRSAAGVDTRLDLWQTGNAIMSIGSVASSSTVHITNNFLGTVFGNPAYGIAITSGGAVGMGALPATSAALDITSTTGALLVPRMTTTQRNALTATNGMILYNTTDNQMQARVNGAWVAL
jgi:hypothetical protein